MNRVFLLIGVLAMFSVPAVAEATSTQPRFVGTGCSQSTCRYFTSSYSTARYYYDRRTCSQWKSLSSTYLRGFKTATALHQKYPRRALHAAC